MKKQELFQYKNLLIKTMIDEKFITQPQVLSELEKELNNPNSNAMDRRQFLKLARNTAMVAGGVASGLVKPGEVFAGYNQPSQFNNMFLLLNIYFSEMGFDPNKKYEITVDQFYGNNSTPEIATFQKGKIEVQKFYGNNSTPEIISIKEI